jgi:hypothetical protein
MCPTELGYDPQVPHCLRLLPIETRLQMQGLAEWRLKPERWVEVPLQVGDADQISRALEKVAQVRKSAWTMHGPWASGMTTCR